MFSLCFWLQILHELGFPSALYAFAGVCCVLMGVRREFSQMLAAFSQKSQIFCVPSWKA
jgi:hypothetical protein